jgi:hypothetical protein
MGGSDSFCLLFLGLTGAGVTEEVRGAVDEDKVGPAEDEEDEDELLDEKGHSDVTVVVARTETVVVVYLNAVI